MGPDGGVKGGRLVVMGTPETVAEDPSNHAVLPLKCAGVTPGRGFVGFRVVVKG